MSKNQEYVIPALRKALNESYDYQINGVKSEIIVLQMVVEKLEQLSARVLKLENKKES